MTVYLVGAGPGDPGLLTRRGAALLSEADVVLYDRLVHHSILALAPVSAEFIDVGKRPDGAQPGSALQDEINRLLVEHGRRCHTVVRLKGGDPFLFGRGGEEVEALREAGVRWEVVPGVSSAFGVPAVAGIPVTHRGVSSSVTVVTGRVDDPSPPAGVNWDALAKVDGTLVILMGMMNRADIADALMRGGKPSSTPAAVIERGTTTDQVVARTTLGGLAEVPLSSPAVIVVGPVATLGAEGTPPAFLPPLSGRTVVVTRSGPRAGSLVEALERAGAEAIEIPLTEQTGPLDGGVALRQAAQDIAQYRWLVFTSVNAVQRFMAELRDARALGGALVAAVGPATADALRVAGVEPDLIPLEHRGVGLIAEFPDHDADGLGNLVLFPCAEAAPATIVEGLREKGWDVRRVEAYRTAALPAPEGWLLERMAHADAVTLSASSSARAYAALDVSSGAPPANVPAPGAPASSALPAGAPPAGAPAASAPAAVAPPLVVCIGPTTAADARAFGLSRVEEARDPSPEGIVDVLVHHLGLGS
jgi:uroporphyrinogen III methyltransferase/synthase